MPGIWRDKTVDDKLIYIPNDDNEITPSVGQNYWLSTFINEAIIVPKDLKPKKSECNFKTSGTSEINSPMSPPSKHKYPNSILEFKTGFVFT